MVNVNLDRGVIAEMVMVDGAIDVAVDDDDDDDDDDDVDDGDGCSFEWICGSFSNGVPILRVLLSESDSHSLFDSSASLSASSSSFASASAANSLLISSMFGRFSMACKRNDATSVPLPYKNKFKYIKMNDG